MIKVCLALISALMAVSCYAYIAHQKLEQFKNDYVECTTQYKSLEDVLELERRLSELTPDDVDKWLFDNGLLAE